NLLVESGTLVRSKNSPLRVRQRLGVPSVERATTPRRHRPRQVTQRFRAGAKKILTWSDSPPPLPGPVFFPHRSQSVRMQFKNRNVHQRGKEHASAEDAKPPFC